MVIDHQQEETNILGQAKLIYNFASASHWVYECGFLKWGKYADCPTVQILSGQYHFGGLCPESRLYFSRDNECPVIG